MKQKIFVGMEGIEPSSQASLYLLLPCKDSYLLLGYIVRKKFFFQPVQITLQICIFLNKYSTTSSVRRNNDDMKYLCSSHKNTPENLTSDIPSAT